VSDVAPSIRTTPARAASRPIWKRLVSAQESGLVLVIAVMMAVLTVFGGSKPSAVVIDIPKGAEVSVQEPAADGQPSILVVKTAGGEHRHSSASAWRVRDQDDGAKRAFGTASVSKFLNKENLVNQTTYASYIAVMAVGMTAIIVLAGIDLSVGSIYALAALLGAQALNSLGETPSTASMILVCLLVCCGAGAVMGFANGFASVALRVHPFVITLGTMAVYRGIVFVRSGGQTVGLKSEALQQGFFKAEIGGVYPAPTLIMLAIAAAGMFVLSRTVLGRRVYAIGGNEVAAKYAGIPVGRIKVTMYTLLGALAGLSGAMYLGYYGAAENSAGTGYELRVIAAAVIGGASLSGGRGSAVGAVLGAILVQLIDNGLVILGIDQSYNQIVMGAAIILAVVVDQTKSKVVK
jgi:ribose/xylose/arabinose/galactoside ABC-type transport system permease subunit